ncbi:SOS response-associated peptidase [Polaromonas sp. P2-4]|nr:SOS response-associated peptidase [Polaromonas sp. P2-4]
MCSNYRPVTRMDRMLTFFGVERARDELPADVWPTGLAPIIRLAQDGSGKKVADEALYGLLPQFAVEVAYGRRTYNARSETVHKLASFREAWAKGWRCIVPAENTFEPCYETGQVVRWAIQFYGSVPQGIGGIWREWNHPDGRKVLTFAMLTVNADGHPVYERFHKPGDEKRMPLILPQEDWGDWLSCPVSEAQKLFKQHMGPFEVFPAPLAPKAPKASSVRTVRPPKPDADGQLF